MLGFFGAANWHGWRKTTLSNHSKQLEQSRRAQHRRRRGPELLEPRLLLSFTAVDSLGGDQAAWVDFDNDGWSDLLAGSILYRNDNGNLTAHTTGLPGAGIFADINNDGFHDYFSYASRAIYLNNKGLNFSGGPSLPPPPEGSVGGGRGAVLGDFNGDSFVDIYLGNYETWPTAYYRDTMYFSNGGHSFDLVWTQGIDAQVTGGRPRPARGVTSFDFDEDHDLDIYVSNYRLEPNALWKNDGTGNITDVAGSRGATAGYGHTIGSAIGDFDSDGHLDIFAGNFSHNWFPQPGAQFLRNTGPDGGYRFQNMLEWKYGNSEWQESYASPAAADYNNDGKLDLFFTTVYGGDYGRLYQNNGNWNFNNVTSSENLSGQPSTYQAAWGDFDNDGDPDLVTGGVLYRNDNNSNNNWLKVKLVGDGANVNSSAIGAIVRADVNGQTITRQITTGTGQGNQDDLTMHFGLGSHSGPVFLQVTWPDKTTTSVQANPNQYLTLPYDQAVFSEIDIGEVGQVTYLTHEPQTIVLNRQYDNPVVFAQSASTNGGDPVVVRVTDVQSDQFTMYLAEPSDEDAQHGNGESVIYIVLEAGMHTLASGARLEVGTVATSDTVGRRINNQWESISFDSSFTSSPVVLSQIQTTDGVSYLQTRQRNITSSSFQLALEQEENINTSHSMETVGYLAMDAGSGNWNGMSYEAFTTPDVVTDSWYQLSYNRFYDSPPNLLTSLTSYMGIDSSHVRYTNLLANGVQLKIDEDTTYDSEVAHNAGESVAYLAIGGQGMLTARDPGVEIGEVHQVTNLTHVPQTFLLGRQYDNPVVFAQSASTNGGDPVVVRVTDVQLDRFTMYLAEPSNEDGLHNNGESVTYIVLEAGTHRLVDGTQLEVGTVATSATVGRRIYNQWDSISFTTSFTATPVVLSQIQTTDGVPYLQTRHTNITSSGIRLGLEQEENIRTRYGVETVGYLAMDARSGMWNNFSYEAGTTPNVVTDSLYQMTYRNVYASPPSLLTSLNSYMGIDSSHIRYTTSLAGSVQLKIDEDTTYDSEVAHNAAESVAYLAIGGQGMLAALRPEVDMGEVGRVTNLTHVSQEVLLERVYSNPVVFAQPASTNGGHPVAVRVTNVQSDRFTLYLAEPSDEDGQHGRLETVSYLVLEAGTHRLGNGTQLEVGTVETSATVGRRIYNQWDSISFTTSFTATPVVLSQIQTTDGVPYLQTRHTNITSSGIRLGLEQEENIRTRHGVETVGYLAMNAGSGAWGNMSYEASYTPMAVTDSWYQLSYQQSYVTLPSLLTSLASYKGIDSSRVRYTDSLTGGVQLKIDEDTTYDTEVRHTAAESVAYLAIGGEGLLSALPPQLPASASSNPSIPVSALQTAFVEVSHHEIAFAEPEARARSSAVESQAANNRVFTALGCQHLDDAWMDDTQFESRTPAGRLQQALLESLRLFG